MLPAPDESSALFSLTGPTRLSSNATIGARSADVRRYHFREWARILLHQRPAVLVHPGASGKMPGPWGCRMTKPIARDAIYRKRVFDSEVVSSEENSRTSVSMRSEQIAASWVRPTLRRS
jgi:hypothetical protein